jgi:hypothetical protein
MHCLRTVSAFEYSGGGAISLCTAYGLCLPLNIPVELFLYSLPKDCTAQGLCLPLNIPCFQSGGTIFWSKTYKKSKKNQLRENKKFKTRVNEIFSNAFQRICWKCCHVLLHVFILVIWFVIDGLFSFYFFSLLSSENYILILFIVSISILVLILLISNFLVMVILYKFYLFLISPFNPNLPKIIFSNLILILLIFNFFSLTLL